MQKFFQVFVCWTLCVTIVSAQPCLSKNNIDDIIGRMTLEEKVGLCVGAGTGWFDDMYRFPGIAGNSHSVERFGIPSIYYCDGPHGVGMKEYRPFDSRHYLATEFPMTTALAATWDTETAKIIGEAIGEEARDFGMDILLAPGINIQRNVLCGRNHEYYSEDPLLAGILAAQFILGVQSTGTGTSLKHFVANNQESNRNNNDARISQRALREIYLKNFEIAVKRGHPWTVMTSFNYVNGVRTTENSKLLTGILRKEWNFQGLVMSDWNAGTDAVASVFAGVDILQPGSQEQYNAIVKAVKGGRLDVKHVNENVRRILQLIVRTHTFNGYNYSNKPELEKHSTLVRKVGAESMVLLQNKESVLPIKPCRIALYGSNSYAVVSENSGVGSTGHHRMCVSLPEGLRNQGFLVDDSLLSDYYYFVKAQWSHRCSSKFPDNMYPPKSLPEMNVEPERQVDRNNAAIITLVRNSTEAADRPKSSFYLTGEETLLINKVSSAYHAKGKKVIVLLNVCGPVETVSWRDKVDAILCVWQPGQEVGNSIVDVLSGKICPSGRLPMTWAVNYGDALSDKNFPIDFKITRQLDLENHPWNNPKVKDIDYTDYAEDIYVGYRYFQTANKKVAYPFGFGLSYTTFKYSKPTVTLTKGGFEVKLNVENTGKKAGREVVELYITAPKGELAKPVLELKSFGKTGTLAPGESQVVTMTVSNYDLASFNEKKMAWEADKGIYTLRVAKNVSDRGQAVTYKLKNKLSWKASTIL